MSDTAADTQASEKPWRDNEDITVFTMDDGVTAYAAGWSATGGDINYAVAMDGYTVLYMPTFGGQSTDSVGFIYYDDGRSTHVFANGSTGWGQRGDPQSDAIFNDFKQAVDLMNNERYILVPEDSSRPVSAREIMDTARAERADNESFYSSLEEKYGKDAVDSARERNWEPTEPAPGF